MTRTPTTGDESYCRVCGQWCVYPYPGYYRDAVCSKDCFDEWRWRDTLHIVRKPYYPRPTP